MAMPESIYVTKLKYFKTTFLYLKKSITFAPATWKDLRLIATT